jgi:hypothetical protein
MQRLKIGTISRSEKIIRIIVPRSRDRISCRSHPSDSALELILHKSSVRVIAPSDGWVNGWHGLCEGCGSAGKPREGVSVSAGTEALEIPDPQMQPEVNSQDQGDAA